MWILVCLMVSLLRYLHSSSFFKKIVLLFLKLHCPVFQVTDIFTCFIYSAAEPLFLNFLTSIIVFFSSVTSVWFFIMFSISFCWNYHFVQLFRLCFPDLSEHFNDLLMTFFFFLGPHLWHMEVPKIGIKSELQLPAYAAAIAMQDPSCVCDVHHSS